MDAERANRTADDLFAEAARMERGAKQKQRTNPDWSAWRMGEAEETRRVAQAWRDLANALAGQAGKAAP